MGRRVAVGRVGDVPEGGSTVVAVDGKDVALFNERGTLYAIDDFCPHMGASLAGGYVEGGVVTCPWHHWRFRLSDGAWADNPRVRIGCYAVHAVGDDLYLELPDGA